MKLLRKFAKKDCNPSYLKKTFSSLTNTNSGGTTLIPCMKANKMVLSENVEGTIVASLKKKVKILNAAALLTVVRIFGLSKLEIFSYIERCFTRVCKTPSFLELDFGFVRKLLSSCGLNVTSEIEVSQAAYAWISHCYQKRCEHAEDLLATVRLSLLSQPALKLIFDKSSSFKKQRSCRSAMEYYLENNKIYGRVSSKLDTNRYCNQYSYKILTSGGVAQYGDTLLSGKIKLVDETKTNSFTFQALSDKTCRYRTAVLNGKIYSFSDDLVDFKFISVFKWLQDKNFNKKVATIEHKRIQYSVCGLIDKVYVIGGNENKKSLNSCIEFDTKSNEYKEVSRMISTRAAASSVVFKGRIVVSGGCYFYNDRFEVDVRTAECYDHASDAWSQLPDMVQPRNCHGCDKKQDFHRWRNRKRHVRGV